MFYSNKPAKLVDTQPAALAPAAPHSELLIVEGDSAALAAAALRNPQTQAVLPMQGKPMNTLRISRDKLLQNPWFAALITALGAGVGDSFNPQHMRYSNIVLLMDPDADGIHCGALMLMFFYRWLRQPLENGQITLIRPPVGESINTRTGEVFYAESEPEFIQHCTQLHQTGEAAYCNTLKYRGLAGMPHTLLENTCINPQTRRGMVVGLKDAQLAMEVFG